MKRGLAFLTTWMLLGGVVTTEVSAQKGMGDKTGVARQAVKPDVVSLSGKLTAIKIGPCGQTTGRASVGTHILLKTPQGKELNIHIGPTNAVDRLVNRLTVGQKLTVKGFRTKKMPADQYVACSLEFNGTSIEFRDKSLAPFWSGGTASARVPAASQDGFGRGRGAGWGRGRGYGQGSAWGRGAGFGQGRGSAAGRGGGSGRSGGFGRGAGSGRSDGFGRGADSGRRGGFGRGAGSGRAWGFVDQDRDGVCDNYRRW